MAFYSDANADYMSLALRPSVTSIQSVFRVSKTQIRACRFWFPTAVPASLLIVMVQLALLMTPDGSIVCASRKEQAVVASATLALAIYFAAVGMFLWIRATPGSIIGRTGAIPDMQIEKGVPLSLYATCLLTLMVPPLGLLNLFGTIVPDAAAIDWAGVVPPAVIAVGISP